MTKAKDLARLGQISQLILDVKLAALHVAAGKRQQSLDLLANLNMPSAPGDLSLIATHRAELQYQHWADARRAEINLLLAHQTAEMHLAHDAAGQAFGKDQALRGLQNRVR